MTVGKIINLVIKLRKAQKEYYKNRSKNNFNDARTLETLVDCAIEEYFLEQKRVD